MIFRRTAATVLLAATTLLGTAVPALAHTELKSSDPASGARLAAPPARVTLTFTENVQEIGVDIKVAGPQGAQWNMTRPEIKGAVVTSAVIPSGPPGDYTLTWKVISADGDRVSGKIAFTLTGPATSAGGAPTTGVTSGTGTAVIVPSASAPGGPLTPAPSAQEQDSGSGMPVWLWLVIGLVVIAAIVAGLLLVRRAKSSG